MSRMAARRMLNARCSFLEASPYELEARVEAAVTIFGREGAARVLGADLSLPLSYSPQVGPGAQGAWEGREARGAQPQGGNVCGVLWGSCRRLSLT